MLRYHWRTLPLRSPDARDESPRNTAEPARATRLRVLRALRSTVVLAAVVLRRDAALLIRCRSAISTCGCRPDAIEGTLVVHIFDVAHDLNIEPPERLLDPAVAAQHVGGAREPARPRGSRSPPTAAPLTPQWSAARSAGRAPVAEARASLRARRARRAALARRRACCFRTIRNHQTFLNIYEGDALTQAILDRGRSRVRVLRRHAPGRVRGRPASSCRPASTTS